jgi:hypothetical protein
MSVAEAGNSMRHAAIALGLLAGAAAVFAATALVAQPSEPAARFDADGRMLFPADYREWIYVTSGNGMSYSPAANAAADPPFDNVFVDPAAYRAFR